MSEFKKYDYCMMFSSTPYLKQFNLIKQKIKSNWVEFFDISQIPIDDYIAVYLLSSHNFNLYSDFKDIIIFLDDVNDFTRVHFHVSILNMLDDYFTKNNILYYKLNDAGLMQVRGKLKYE